MDSLDVAEASKVHLLRIVIPEETGNAMTVTMGTHHAGSIREKDGVKPSATVYQTFRLIP